jgi:hypothetical protein
MSRKSLIEESKKDVTMNAIGYIGDNNMQLGAILRIADACEDMARNHTSLIEEKERYKRWYEQEKAKVHKLEHCISGLRGYLKRLRKVKK